MPVVVRLAQQNSTVNRNIDTENNSANDPPKKMNKIKTHFRTNLKIMNCATQETTMRRITKVTNIYNPHQYTYPCNNL